MRNSVLAIPLLLTYLSGFPTPPKYESQPHDITYCQLASNPAQYAGKRLRIQAIYSYMFEVSTLLPPTCCNEHNIDMWVDFDDELEGESQKLFSKFPQGMGFVLAVFVGTIETGGAYGTGQRFHFFVEHIEEVRQQAKSPLKKFPRWIPQNCATQTRQAPSAR